MKDKKLIIFDFDGVIIDSSRLSYDLLVQTNPELDYDSFKKMSNGNFLESVGEIVHNPSFREQYRSGVSEIHIAPSIHKAIFELSKKYSLAIVSSASEVTIKMLLNSEGLLEKFQDILGAETHSSKVIKIGSLVEKYSVAPSDIAFITDTLGDIREGNIAGVNSIGVTWGLHNRETLELGSPVVIIEKPELLEESIETIFN
jgi:phosphoglycolate phosphatase